MGVAAAISAVAGVIAEAGVDAGVATALATAVVGAAGGGVIGGAVDAFTGKPILPGIEKGAEAGGITGLGVGAGGAVAGALGEGAGTFGAAAGEVLGGAAGGALGGVATGGSPATGALTGAISGGVAGAEGLTAGASGGTGGDPSPTGVSTGAGTSAAGGAAPAGAGIDVGAALTAGGGGEAGLPVFAPGGGSPLGGVDAAGAPLNVFASTDGPTIGNRDVLDPSVLTTGTPATAPGSGGVIPTGGPIFNTPAPSGNAFTNLFSPTPDPIAGTLNLGTATPITAATPISISVGSDDASGGFLSNLFGGGSGDGSGGGGIGNKLPLAIAGAGVGLDLLKGNQPLPNQNALQTEASDLASQGHTLQSYLATGTLPPGVQASITSAADSAKAAIRSRYAQMGGDTSAMQQDLANVDQTAATQGATIATNLLQEGVSETGLSEQIYSQLLNLAVSQNQQLGAAIGNLAIAAAGTPSVLRVQAAP